MLEIGAPLDRYEIAEELEEGKFATVYRGQDHDLDRSVVVKVFNPACTVADYPPEIWRARFLMEARAMARIDHEFVCPILAFGRTMAGSPYLVIPYFPDDLKRRLGSDEDDPELVAAMSARRMPKRLTLAECVRLTGQILQALEANHGAGVIHRDLKPTNIMLSARADDVAQEGVGDVRIVDFGLALHPNLRMTRSTGWLGSENYMSPEQRESTAEADARADLYAVGVIFFRMLTGHLPKGRPDAGVLGPEATPAVTRWLAAMLAREPNARPRSAAKARERLLEITQFQ